MKALATIMALTLFAAPLAGCLVRSDRHHHRGGHSARRGGNDCGPAYHWNGYKCVHNGNGRHKGHRK